MIGPILGGAALVRYDAAKVKVLAVGNSIIYGQGASDRATTCWVKLLENIAPLAGTGITVQNNGVGGNTITAAKPGYSSMTARLSTDVNALDVSKLNVVICGEFTNEIGAVMANTGNGADGALAHSVWVTYFKAFRAAAKAKGAQVRMITVTTIPAGAPRNATADQLAYAMDVNENGFKVANTIMRNTWRSYADGIIDTAAVPEFAALFNNSTYTAPVVEATLLYRQPSNVYDGYHPGDAGYAKMVTAAPQPMRRVPLRTRL